MYPHADVTQKTQKVRRVNGLGHVAKQRWGVVILVQNDCRPPCNDL